MTELATYEKMKDSGIDWIGDVPSHWRIHTLYQLVTQVKEKNSELQEKNLLSLSYGKIKRKDIDSPDGLLPASFDGYNIIEDGDIVLRLTDLQNDHTSLRVGLATERGIITSAYTTLRPTEIGTSKYLYYLIHAFDLKKGFYGMGSGVRQGLNYGEVKELRVVLPPLEEQAAIADFLDEQCAQIDSVIAETKATIEGHKKLKASMICEIVTKGLNPDVETKDSGVEWIGKVPRHWSVVRFKFTTDSISKGSGITKDDIVEDGDTPCIRYGEIYTKYNHAFTICKTRTNVEKITSPQHFSYGDLLFCGTGELVEEIGKCIVYLGSENCLAGGDIIVAKHKHNPAFMGYALDSDYAQKQKSCGKAKLKVVHISASNIGNLMVAIPPEDEQEQIASYLDEKCAHIDCLISIKQSLISDLELYKRSLIYETVTGKRKVV